jgi:uncharacterized protein (DUF305 family)
MHRGHDGHDGMSAEMVRHHYLLLGINLMLGLAIMYFVMFAMIASWGEFIQNINFFYMALMMWAPMGALMLLTMPMMYPNKTLNMALHALFALVFILSTIGIREQGLVGDRQFLRSMIPHHSGAVLMCSQASITDPQIKQLCGGIVASQKSEIKQMKAMLDRPHR